MLVVSFVGSLEMFVNYMLKRNNGVYDSSVSEQVALSKLNPTLGSISHHEQPWS